MKDSVRQTIANNIRRYGYHTVVVAPGGATPRWAYTIGLSETKGRELLFAGCVSYLKDEMLELIDRVAKSDLDFEGCVGAAEIPSLSVNVIPVDPTWSERLMIGVNGYYGASRLALQMVPTKNRTIDTPRTDIPYSVATAGAFRWLEGEWPYPVPVNSEVMVDVGVTTGGTILEVGRWEDNYWEMFSVPREKIDKSKARLVPLGVLLAFDPALVFVTNLAVGESATREPGRAWEVRRGGS